jgi:hypothetical protein
MLLLPAAPLLETLLQPALVDVGEFAIIVGCPYGVRKGMRELH